MPIEPGSAREMHTGVDAIPKDRRLFNSQIGFETVRRVNKLTKVKSSCNDAGLFLRSAHVAASTAAQSPRWWQF